MAERSLSRGLTYVGVLMARPAAFAIFGAYVVAWVVLQPHTLDWHGAATLVTWLMTLFIQRAGHRDTQAIQAKLDELLRAQTNARTELSELDHKTAEEIEQHREREQGGSLP